MNRPVSRPRKRLNSALRGPLRVARSKTGGFFCKHPPPFSPPLPRKPSDRPRNKAARVALPPIRSAGRGHPPGSTPRKSVDSQFSLGNWHCKAVDSQFSLGNWHCKAVDSQFSLGDWLSTRPWRSSPAGSTPKSAGNRASPVAESGVWGRRVGQSCNFYLTLVVPKYYLILLFAGIS
ncbi:hypothetical protein R80B4_01625 [Fibrobacteres bacterium R8-0-B4]